MTWAQGLCSNKRISTLALEGLSTFCSFVFLPRDSFCYGVLASKKEDLATHWHLNLRLPALQEFELMKDIFEAVCR